VVDYRAGGINTIGTLDILQEIFDDRLYIFASYDSNFFAESRIDSLIREYIAQIKELTSLSIRPQQAIQPSKLQTDARLEATLQEVAQSICHHPISSREMNLDLEADLGMDSLDLIRIVAGLEKLLGKCDRQTLLRCRSLREMESVIVTAQALAEDKKSEEIPYLRIIEQAQRTPEAVAVLHGETKLTYAQLHRLSNQVANYLRTQGVGPNTLVGIMTQRSPLMLVGILGILKAGAAYVPLEPSYPEERIRYMLDHAEIRILLTEHQLAAKLAKCLNPQLPLHTLIFMDEGDSKSDKQAFTQVSKNTWSTFSAVEPPCVNTPDDLMTVLYTSGSTGRPKGVMLNHRGYMNRLQWMQNTFQLALGERVAQKTSCCFDISVWEMFWPLMVGATVCPVETETVKNPWELAQWLKDTQINIMHFVPSLFGEFMSALEGELWTFPDLRWLIFSGESLPVPFIQRWIDQFGTGIGLANLYGPTEASIDVTAHIIRQRPGQEENRIPIGKPIDNVQIAILDEQMQPVAPGQLGELWIGGVQLAKGYLNDPQRTSKAFHPNPFPHIWGEHLYRSGDLARQLPDGSFEYHGRIDHQVKIRGFRIELGEIESVLNAHPAVHEAAVLAVDYGSGQKKLVATLAGRNADNTEIKEHLAQRLPDYMIPHRWEWLPSLPKNHNGKLDRKALQALLNEGHSVHVADRSDDYLPLGPAQRWLVTYFEPPYQWSAYTRFRFHQPLEADVFNLALNLVVQRHSALRTVFVLRDGQWQQQVIDPKEHLSAEFYDGSHLEAEGRDREIHHMVQQISQKFRIDEWPLLKAIAIKVNESCHEIILIAHHIIGDMLSGAVLFKELWHAYSQMLVNHNFSFENPSSPSYADFVRLLLEEEDKRGALASHVDYWKSRFPSREYSFHVPFDHIKGANVEASASSQRFTLCKSDSNTLLREAKQHYKSNLYPLLLAPLYRLLADWCSQSWVVLSHRTHGRKLNDNQIFLESFGNFAVNFPIGIKVEPKEGWEQIVKLIKGEFEELPMNGITFDWVSDQLPGYIYPDKNLTPVRANYLGNRSVPPMELFEFVEEDHDRRLSPPEQKRTTLLEFFFFITDETCHLEIEYSRNFHLPATISELGNRYLELMHEMLATVSPRKTVLGRSNNPALLTREVCKMKRLEDKVALVTGGSGGIGRATALAFAREGAKVVIASRRFAESEETVRLVKEAGSEAIFVKADVTKPTDIELLVNKTVETYGSLDCAFNNAGTEGNLGLLIHQTEENWDSVIDTNLKSVWLSMKYQISQMLKQGGGTIVNNASIAGLVGFAGSSVYVASKHGVLGLTKSAALEYAKSGIRINAVCPAAVQTPLLDRFVGGFEEAKAQFADQHPIGRIAKPEEIAEAVIWLCSDATSFVIGHPLVLDGGFTVR
jgi:amino acid adenylation domain-containing protein